MKLYSLITSVGLAALANAAPQAQVPCASAPFTGAAPNPVTAGVGAASNPLGFGAGSSTQAAGAVSGVDASAQGLVAQGSFVTTALDQQPMKDGAKRATINYGPMTLRPKAMANVPSLMMEKPCTDCYITAIQATLKYMDGSIANSDTGV
ncbi:hypothetical protein LTS18_005450, partial [Coniosporium uncinatum]